MKHTLEYYLAAAQDTVSRSSRTAGTGTIDAKFSGSSDKPKAIIDDPAQMKRIVERNVDGCVRLLYENRKLVMTPGALETLFELTASLAVRDTIAPRPSVYRTHEIDPKKGYGVPVSDIGPLMKQFFVVASATLVKPLSPDDVVAYGALFEKVIDRDIHALADACGRVSKLFSLYIAMRNDLPAKVYPGREFYKYDTMGPRYLDHKMFELDSAEGIISLYKKQPDFAINPKSGQCEVPPLTK